jgi:hypothetical protein
MAWAPPTLQVQQGRRGENIVVGQTLRPGRRDNEHPRHTGDLGRNDVHEQGGRIDRLAARDVDADPVNGAHLPAEHASVVEKLQVAVLPLPPVEGLDILAGLNPDVLERRVEVGHGAVKRVLRHPEGFGTDAVEPFAETAQRGVSPGFHLGQDFPHLLGHLLGLGFQRGKLFQVRLRRFVDLDHVDRAAFRGFPLISFCPAFSCPAAPSVSGTAR